MLRFRYPENGTFRYPAPLAFCWFLWYRKPGRESGPSRERFFGANQGTVRAAQRGREAWRESRGAVGGFRGRKVAGEARRGFEPRWGGMERMGANRPVAGAPERRRSWTGSDEANQRAGEPGRDRGRGLALPITRGVFGTRRGELAWVLAALC